MVDNVTIPTTGTGTATPVVGTDDVGGAHYQRMKIANGEDGSSLMLGIYAEDEAHADGDTGILALVQRSDTPGNRSGTDLDYEMLQMSGGKLWVAPLEFPVNVSTDITRPGNITTYTINDALADTTPTAGGFTFTGAARKSGGSGLITDMWVTFEEDAAVPLQGEIHIFDTSVTAITDNAAYAISDAEAKTQVAIIPFSLADNGNQGVAHVQNLAIEFTCSGSANLRFLVKVKNGYIPTTNSSILTVKLKINQLD